MDSFMYFFNGVSALEIMGSTRENLFGNITFEKHIGKVNYTDLKSATVLQFLNIEVPGVFQHSGTSTETAKEASQGITMLKSYLDWEEHNDGRKLCLFSSKTESYC